MSYLNLRLYQRNTQCLHIRKHRLAGFFVRLFVACAFAAQTPLSSAELYFNPRFLADDPQAVADLSRFENGQELPPGTYRVDIYLNNGYMATRDVTFNTGDSEQGIVPCLTRAQLASMGLNTASVSGMNLLADDACVPLTSMIHDATAHLDVGQQRLNLTIPQAFMSNRARGYIPPELWDPGINAGLLNYNFSGNSVQNRIGGNNHYAYLNLQSGLNIGAWRLRDNTSWSYNSSDRSSGSKNKWQHINTWLERDIIPLRSRLTLGDGYTQGDIFDGINFRGA
ncbi:fimbrial usher FimD, partial [Escherichia coli]|nr:fimbrial usher FimD [Escherichia coli]